MGSRRAAGGAAALLQEAHAIEVLLDEIVPDERDVEHYWDVSTRLINLVLSLETLAGIRAGEDDLAPARAELSAIESAIADMASHTGWPEAADSW